MNSSRPEITPERIEQINKMIADNPDWHRTKISQELCRLWGWIGENGQIKDVSCRDVLRALDSMGKIKLPQRRAYGHTKGGIETIAFMLHDTLPIETTLSNLTPLAVEVVKDKHSLMEFKSYIAQYHYLGYDRNIGENIKYFVYDCNGRQIACLMFGSAAWSCQGRDKFIGWNKNSRNASSLRYITNNSRFLIFPWIKVPHLASHILSLISRRISSDWMEKYGHLVYLLETFVERDRFKGTCYKAANWIYVGETTGRGRNDIVNKYALPKKEVFLYPLHKRYSKKLNDTNV
jgi:hypothetical protein